MYAVYDTTYERFLQGTYDKKADAEKAAKAAGEAAEVREVDEE